MGGLKPGARSALAKRWEEVCGWAAGSKAAAMCSETGVSATVWQIWHRAQVAQSAPSVWCRLSIGTSARLAWPGQSAWVIAA